MNPFSCLFQLAEATCIPWIVAPSSLFKTSSMASSDLPLILPVLLPSEKDPHDNTVPAEISQDHLPLSPSQLHHNCTVPLSRGVACPWGPGFRYGCLWGLLFYSPQVLFSRGPKKRRVGTGGESW